jgi:hypothetical protein
MKWKTSLVSAVLCLGAQAQALSYGPNRDSLIHILGPQGVNLWKLDHSKHSRLFVQDSQSSQIPLDFEDEDKKKNPGNFGFLAQWFQQPLDHFDKKSQHVFHQRYWVNSRHYKPRKGAPVIVLDGGETSGEVCPMDFFLNVNMFTNQFFLVVSGSFTILGYWNSGNIGQSDERDWYRTRT